MMTWALAAHFKTRVALRIDDLDTLRIKPEYIDNIFQVLEQLQLRPDKGPQKAEQVPEWSQHTRWQQYETFLERLIQSGRVYACSCSRATILASDPSGRYPGTCRERNLPLDEPNLSWRLNTQGLNAVKWEDALLGPQQLKPAEDSGDWVIRRRDGLPAYHIASLSDDLNCKVDLIVRGEDLLPSTAVQISLARLAGYEQFGQLRFYHHPLLLNETGQKLSKSAGTDKARPWTYDANEIRGLYQQCALWLNPQKAAHSRIESLQELRDLLG